MPAVAKFVAMAAVAVAIAVVLLVARLLSRRRAEPRDGSAYHVADALIYDVWDGLEERPEDELL
jgi:hypothetical protein